MDYEMTQEDLDKILEACKPASLIMLQCGSPPSIQERANAAWQELGGRMGFDHMTVRPSGKGNRFFTASPLPEFAANHHQWTPQEMNQITQQSVRAHTVFTKSLEGEFLADDLRNHVGEIRKLSPMVFTKPKCQHEWAEKDGQTDIDGSCTKCGTGFWTYVNRECP